MQKRIEIPAIGGAFPLLRAKLLDLLKAWPDKSLVMTAEQLSTLCLIATEPEWLVKQWTIVTPAQFASLYASKPDFVLAVLSKARHEWNKLGRTKFGRVQKFVATNTHFKPHGNFAARPWCKLQGHWEAATDGDISQAYEIASGEPVKVELVTKARKKVAAEVKRGIALHAKLTKPAAAKGGKLFEETFRLNE